jgi:hypothetical protein
MSGARAPPAAPAAPPANGAAEASALPGEPASTVGLGSAFIGASTAEPRFALNPLLASMANKVRNAMAATAHGSVFAIVAPLAPEGFDAPAPAIAPQ